MSTVTVSPRDLEAVFFDIGGTLVGPNVALLGTWLRAAGIDCVDDRVSLVEPFARRAHALRRQSVLGTPAIRGLYLEEVIRHVWGDRPGDPSGRKRVRFRLDGTGIHPLDTIPLDSARFQRQR